MFQVFRLLLLIKKYLISNISVNYFDLVCFHNRIIIINIPRGYFLPNPKPELSLQACQPLPSRFKYKDWVKSFSLFCCGNPDPLYNIPDRFPGRALLMMLHTDGCWLLEFSVLDNNTLELLQECNNFRDSCQG